MYKTGGPFAKICTSSEVFLCKECLFGVTVIALALTFVVALIF